MILIRLPWAQRLTAVASLGDAKRRDLYDYVSSSTAAVGRDAAAEALGMARSTASFHLDKLVEDGLLAVEFHKPAGKTGPGSGRPAKMYRAVIGEVGASVPDRNYDLAGELLATAIEEAAQSGTEVRQVLLTSSYQRGKELASGDSTLEAFLVNQGYAPRSDGQGGFVLPNCPFHRLSARHPGVVCAMNGAFLRGAAAGCGEAEKRITGNQTAGQCCAHITAAP
ncbi:helix-turn-helix transcriptional regulator [Pseudarthrobacter sp. NPDC055928]|uniref:helix-turn-helix transcriptional regulator n=1 Tax=Pseudarthrobacter sp. NPDC055928 TaxID=3345661 RepID=UPI0035D6BD93